VSNLTPYIDEIIEHHQCGFKVVTTCTLVKYLRKTGIKCISTSAIHIFEESCDSFGSGVFRILSMSLAFP
jgi:hypothetical protein